jgi:hypothetical protein
MTIIEGILWGVLAFFIYQIGSFILFYRLCKKVINQMQESGGNIPDTKEVKELEEIVGREQIEELYKKVNVNE